ncbi:DEAD/DEAH box helicase family protein [Candidatus Pelagibacter sp. HIMB1517]|uniref:DEAD/DEAH box helicase family protein n=1 Tax=Candidatus Pelagibacter sp. HIMB1517 TaxID=3413341 RepID=UPI003F8332C5
MKHFQTHKSWKSLNQELAKYTTSGRAKLAGDIFEKLCKYFLQTEPEYRSELKNVWLLKEVKEHVRKKLNLPSADEGIDLIAETKDKKYWAIQCKYRSNPKDTLTVKGDLATFSNLAFNVCKNISHGLVMTTAEKPPKKTKYLKGIGYVTSESFLSLDNNNCERWKYIRAKAKGKIIKPPKLSPRSHQIKAISETVKYFKSNERGKVIMPCGTGKSLTAFWIARKMNAKNIIIAIPSLALLQQTLKVWTREYLLAGINPDWMCVCSDKTVSDDQDDFVTSIADLGIDVTTDKSEIKKFLKTKSKNPKIIFTTYQSGKVTAQGAKGFMFDLGIMDEAHKTVGHGEKPMAHLIHQKNIKIKKRLFMTATERLFRGNKDEYLSMDDPRDYGDIIYQLSFKEAIECKPPIISDYKIITFGIKNFEIEQIFNSNKFIQVKKEIKDIKAREFAIAIALRKAIKKLKINNAISFHSSIRRADNFRKQQDLISKVYKDYGKLKTFHVSGAMPTNERTSQMRLFAESKGLMTNARCLTEGVDLPAIDCVVFTDPKRSKVDIVQAAGRAMRLAKGKKFGYILIPLIIPDDENATEAAKDTAFEEIVTTIRALSTQDTRIADYLRGVASGKKPRGGSPVDGITKINVLTKINEDKFNRSIQLKVWDRVAFGNWRSYEEAKKWVQSFQFKSSQDYKNKMKKMLEKKTWPPDIRRDPKAYKEFKSYIDYLGTNTFSPKERGKLFKSYKETKAYLKKFKITTLREYRSFLKKYKGIFPLPASPYEVYKKEWVHWGDYLSNDKLSKDETSSSWKSYDETRKFVLKLKLKNESEWRNYIKNNKMPKGITRSPRRIFTKSGDWKGIGHFLGTSYSSGAHFMDFKKARLIVRKFKIKNMREYISRAQKKNWNRFIPRQPMRYYKNKGWTNWDDFLGRK